MAELKTKPTNASVAAFLKTVEKAKADDCKAIMKMMEKATGATPKLWGPSIIGFGDYHYKYASGREGDWFLVGLSPRKANISLYLMGGFGAKDGLIARLGKHKTGKGCLYINRLGDVDANVLDELIVSSIAKLKR